VLISNIFLANPWSPHGKLAKGAGGACHHWVRWRQGEGKMSLKLQGLESVVRIPDWRLTTAELLYHLPDHPHVLQSFIWQKLDRAPDFPELDRFLAFWQREIDGPLHSVRVASTALTRPAELRYANGVFTLH
jgi:uncharacterized protein Usg